MSDKSLRVPCFASLCWRQLSAAFVSSAGAVISMLMRLLCTCIVVALCDFKLVYRARNRLLVEKNDTTILRMVVSCIVEAMHSSVCYGIVVR